MKKEKLYDVHSGKATANLTPGCICLEGGAFRGLYTSGVLDALMENDICMQTVIGVSAGAFNSVNYTAGHIGRSARLNLYYRHDSRYMGVNAFVHNKGVIGFEFVFTKFAKLDPFDYVRFMRPEQRFIAVATDVISGKPQYFEKGKVSDILKAVRASASMQYLSIPVSIDGKKCLDGACTVSIPYQWAVDNKFEKILVVRTRPKGFRKDETEVTKISSMYKRHTEFYNQLKNAKKRYNLECDEIEKLEEEGKAFVLYPQDPVAVSKLEGDTDKLYELYMQGYNDTIAAMPGLIEYLGKDSIGSIKCVDFIKE